MNEAGAAAEPDRCEAGHFRVVRRVFAGGVACGRAVTRRTALDRLGRRQVAPAFHGGDARRFEMQSGAVMTFIAANAGQEALEEGWLSFDGLQAGRMAVEAGEQRLR